MSIRSFKRFLIVCVCVIGAGAAIPAIAQSRGHGGGWHGGGGWHHGGWHGGGPGWWGFGVGTYYMSPYYYYPYPVYYYPDAVVAPPGSPGTANWYFCDSAQTYYPYVRQCPEPWRVVPAVPPPPR